MVISTLRENQNIAWDNYVRNHPQGTVYHLSGWQNVIENTYGHRTYYLMATENKSELTARNDKKTKGYELSTMRHELHANPVVGILPLVHINHFIFGNSLISMPFLDYGGILADHQDVEKALLLRATELGRGLGARRMELRQIEPLSWFNEAIEGNATTSLIHETLSHKVRMTLSVPGTPESLFRSFKSKLRSQIKKPLREGCTAVIGHTELLDAFYEVFSTNMRDLGSPVHSKRLIENVLNEFPGEARICMVFRGKKPLCASVVIGFKDTLENPWASSLRAFRRLSPNMLLYWAMLEYTCNGGFKYFDFGRSSLNEGTYRFKEQWGSKPVPLHWHYISLDGQPVDPETSKKSRFERGIEIWQKLPVPITKIIGPRIRKYIGL